MDVLLKHLSIFPKVRNSDEPVLDRMLFCFQETSVNRFASNKRVLLIVLITFPVTTILVSSSIDIIS